MAKTRKLSYDDWLQLSNLMENVPDPDTTYTATGWHYELMNFLRTLGYRNCSPSLRGALLSDEAISGVAGRIR